MGAIAAFSDEQYQIIGRLIDEKVAQAIAITVGRATLFLRDIRDEASESLKGTTAGSVSQVEIAVIQTQAATLTRVDVAFKVAAAIETERVDAMLDSAAVGFKAEQAGLNGLIDSAAPKIKASTKNNTQMPKDMEGKLTSVESSDRW